MYRFTITVPPHSRPNSLPSFAFPRPALPAAVILSLSWVPGGAEAQDPCPDGIISAVEVRNHSVFPPEDLPDDGRLRWAYALSNSVRVRTREDFIRNKLLLREGECYHEGLAQESGRILREFRFIGRADVTRETRPDGTVEVEVETRDEWSTKVSLNLRFEDGVHFEGASLMEENFLGRGIKLEFFRVSREAEQSTGALAEVPAFGGSDWDFVIGGHGGRIGAGAQQMLIHPFLGEVGRSAIRQSVGRTRTLFPYAVPEEMRQGEDGLSHLVVPLVTHRAELSGARRWGEPGDLRLLGIGISYERVDPGEAGEVEGVQDGRFGTRTPVSQEEAGAVASQLMPRQAVRLNLVAGVRRISYQYRYGLDALTGVQDFPVGREVLLSTGRSVGSTGRDRPGDVYAGLRLRMGWGGETRAVYFSGAVEGRREDGTGSVTDRWADLIAETHGFFYWQPYRLLARTILVRATAQGGWDTSSPFQLTLGGSAGVRGYREWELPVGRKVVATVESRGRFPGPFPGLVDLGFTLFGDLGKGWEGDVPLARATGWRSTLGAGLRFGFPAGSSSVVRVDAAFPMGPHAESRRPVIRISAREWIGILDDFRSPDVARSRRSGISPDYLGVARGGSVP